MLVFQNLGFVLRDDTICKKSRHDEPLNRSDTFDLQRKPLDFHLFKELFAALFSTSLKELQSCLSLHACHHSSLFQLYNPLFSAVSVCLSLALSLLRSLSCVCNESSNWITILFSGWETGLSGFEPVRLLFCSALHLSPSLNREFLSSNYGKCALVWEALVLSHPTYV